MWRLSASLMSNGATLAVKPGNTGSGTRTTPKQAVYWPTLLVPEPIKRAGSYWHCLPPSTSACSPAMTGAAMAGWCRRISIWPAKYSPNALSVIIWRYAPALSGWLVKQSASHAQLRSTKKWSERLSKNTCSTNWMHYQILNRGYISLHFSFINPVFFTESIYQYPVHTLLKKIIYTEWVIMRLIYHNIRWAHRWNGVGCVSGARREKVATDITKKHQKRSRWILHWCIVMQPDAWMLKSH